MSVRPPSVIYRLELDDPPNWLSHMEISRVSDVIHIELIKTSGLSYVEARISDTDFNDMADALLTRK